MNFKKTLSLLMIGAVLVCSLISCNEPEPSDPCDHADTDNNGVCDTCDEGLPTVTYTVTVKDDSNRAVAGIEVKLEIVGADPIFVDTDANGKASFSVDTDKASRVSRASVPTSQFPQAGLCEYNLKDYLVRFASGAKEATITLEKLEAKYVYVKDREGNAVEGVGLQVCHTVCLGPTFVTDSDGKATVYCNEELAYAMIKEAPSGYSFDPNYHFYVSEYTESNGDFVVIIDSAE